MSTTNSSSAPSSLTLPNTATQLPQGPTAGRAKKSGKLMFENPSKKFYQKAVYKRFVVLTSKKILCFKDAEVCIADHLIDDCVESRKET